MPSCLTTTFLDIGGTGNVQLTLHPQQLSVI